jgi:hypothetical protein
MPRKPYEIFYVLVKSEMLRNLFAQRFAIPADSPDLHRNTVKAWGRPVLSDDYPTGTGKPNPLDQILRVMLLAHPIFPIEVREIAEVVMDLANRLDMQQGIAHSQNNNPCSLVMKSLREQLDVLEQIEAGDITPEKIKLIEKEWSEFESSFYQVKGCVKGIIEKAFEDSARGE